MSSPPQPPAEPSQSTVPLSSHCTTSPALPSNSPAPSGTLTTVSSPPVQCYISKPSSYPSSPSKLLLLLTPGTGIKSVNNQLQADAWMRKGYIVMMPDQFGGDVAPNSVAEETEAGDSGLVDQDPTPTDGQPPPTQTQTENPNPSSNPISPPVQQENPQSKSTEPKSPSLLTQIKSTLATTAKSFLLDMWLARHTPEKVLPVLHRVLAATREEFADAVEYGQGVYAVGYCFGGRYVLILGAEGEEEDGAEDGKEGENQEGGGGETKKTRKAPAIKAGAVAHPTLVTVEEMQNVRVPVGIIAVENDPLFPPEIFSTGLTHLAKNSVEHSASVYKGVPHGFAVVGDYGDDFVRREGELAFEEMGEWVGRF